MGKIISLRELSLKGAVKIVGPFLGWARQVVGKQFMSFTSTSLHAAPPEQENSFWLLQNMEAQAYYILILIAVSDGEIATTVH